MQSIQQTITVGFQYPVHFTDRVFDLSNVLLANTVRGSKPDGTGYEVKEIDRVAMKQAIDQLAST